LPVEHDLGLRASARKVSSGIFEVSVSAQRFAQAVHFDVAGLVPDDAYFHLSPGETHVVVLRASANTAAGMPATVSGDVRAINSDAAVSIKMESDPT
jgi:hypothetical protein